MLQIERNARRRMFVRTTLFTTIKDRGVCKIDSLYSAVNRVMSYTEYTEAVGRLEAVGLVAQFCSMISVTEKGRFVN